MLPSSKRIKTDLCKKLAPKNEKVFRTRHFFVREIVTINLFGFEKRDFLIFAIVKNEDGGVQTRTRPRLASGCPVAFIVPNN